jgi:septum formation inhibitor MinC
MGGTEKLESEIKRIEDRIKEKKASLPAHSVKPEMIQELEDLEEELEKSRKELERIERG